MTTNKDPLIKSQPPKGGSDRDRYDEMDCRPEIRETGVKTPAYLEELLKKYKKKP